MPLRHVAVESCVLLRSSAWGALYWPHLKKKEMCLEDAWRTSIRRPGEDFGWEDFDPAAWGLGWVEGIVVQQPEAPEQQPAQQPE